MSGVEDGAPYCARCGESSGVGDHAVCARWLAAEEPPRFCVQCRRRMKVQVTPTRWSAVCVQHGELSGGQPTS